MVFKLWWNWVVGTWERLWTFYRFTPRFYFFLNWSWILWLSQSTFMANSMHISEEDVYLCTGNPMPRDIERIASWLLNESFTKANNSQETFPFLLKLFSRLTNNCGFRDFWNENNERFSSCRCGQATSRVNTFFYFHLIISDLFLPPLNTFTADL